MLIAAWNGGEHIGERGGRVGCDAIGSPKVMPSAVV